ncbi:MAG: MBL fold metallo-hydrolase [Cyclobacteriaceae bacterium]|nr:MBL fold metallo-hydrolase [Cyclobacteriaceae bacterium]
MKNTGFFCLLILCSFQISAQQNFDTLRIRPQKITENIYLLKGAGGNIGLLIGKEGTLMIDDQFAPLSNKINGAIKTIDPGEIRFLVNTHLHGDHSGGNENFKRMGVTIVAHDLVRDRMMKEQMNVRTNRATPPRDKDAWPAITFANQLNFHLNDEDIELVHFDNGHTDGDIFVHFKKANIWHTGDAFTRTGYPFVDTGSGGTFSGYISTLEKALAMMDDNSKVIPGHGDLGTKSDVKIFRDKLVDIRDQVLAALKKGKKVEDIPALGITDKYEAELGKGFVKGKDFVLLVAEQLKGELPVRGKK